MVGVVGMKVGVKPRKLTPAKGVKKERLSEYR